ncbi:MULTISPECIES: trans-aconitate 2-methyltransferase [unclassified Ensifer]|uniref:trans-aconitate 2-methyltransferase n=1 Tax=unclassified Ensifer TaxID=2633371 RepID=UPI000813052F|nr:MULTISPECIES: trans-aconitate 2-methyltransferase [unclassified Ensifer]OCP07145.1 trans-aconitate 2-methyltransferase [Ensifer sp. LC11]OCP07728.1 trans-aconitate 2-methyltransferase [Ensifer sp. LC13]OCP12110.1 trans-aconitate 2-methyltransferase [Ensifer sp. LC14]OCP31821.1 trans-aconitate 2-methyltransferase [Ensifer sp. LC499]
MVWSPAQYLKFEDERTRPARDLLAQVPELPEGIAFDLGCGPGNSTELIRDRFPWATLSGLDSDENMLVAAAKRLPGITFERADLANWSPPNGASLFYANAVFQWLPNHLAIFERLMTALAAGGTLAVQMPDNPDEPTHLLMEDVARSPAFADAFAGKTIRRAPLTAPATYVECLAPQAANIEVWHTIYYHRLANAEAIVEWVKGTGLRPYLDALPEARRDAYLAAYTDRIRSAYPAMGDGKVLLRFPRFFLVAVKA